MNELHVRLKEAMEHNRISAADLCRKTNIHPSDISRYLSGERSPNAYKLLKIAGVLEVNPYWLMGMETNLGKPCFCPWCGKELPKIKQR